MTLLAAESDFEGDDGSGSESSDIEEPLLNEPSHRPPSFLKQNVNRKSIEIAALVTLACVFLYGIVRSTPSYCFGDECNRVKIHIIPESRSEATGETVRDGVERAPVGFPVGHPDTIRHNGSFRHTIDMLAQAMRPYRATPWYKFVPQDEEPQWGPLDYRDFPVNVWSQERSTGALTFKNAHTGDLLEHSKWTALQLAVWLKNDDAWTEGLDGTLVLLAGFLHDLGKGGDCSFSCTTPTKDQEKPRMVQFISQDQRARRAEHCYLDTYSPLKYERQDDILHPIYSSKYLELSDPFHFWLSCPSEDEMKKMWHHPRGVGRIRHSARYRDDLYIVTSQLQHWKDDRLEKAASTSDGDRSPVPFISSARLREGLELSPMQAYYIIVAARMHWDLGRMNMRSSDHMYLDADGYLKKFAAVMGKYAECGSGERGPDCISGDDGNALFDCRRSRTATLDLLKFCIAVAAADISGGSPSRSASRMGTGEVVFVTNATNAALALCKEVQTGEGAPVRGLTPREAELIRDICAAGCDASEGDGGRYCALTQRYPGLDVWTAFGFEGKGLQYREALLRRFGELASSEETYEAWCTTDMVDLAEMPKIEYSPLISDDTVDDDGYTLYVQTLPLTGKEVSSCKEDTRYGFVEGICFKDLFGRCRVREGVTIPCSSPQNITLPREARHRLSTPTEAESLAFVYNNGENAVFRLGGFIYLDKNGNVIRVNYLVDGAHAKDKSHPVRFGGARRAGTKSYNLLRNALNSGVTMTDYQEEVAPTLASKVSRYVWVWTPEMPHGGFAYIMK